MNRKYINNITSSTVENPEWRPQTASLTLLYKIHYNIVAIDPAVYLTPWSFKKLHAHTYASQLLCSQTTQTSSNSLQAAPSFTNSPSSPRTVSMWNTLHGWDCPHCSICDRPSINFDIIGQNFDIIGHYVKISKKEYSAPVYWV